MKAWQMAVYQVSVGCSVHCLHLPLTWAAQDEVLHEEDAKVEAEKIAK